MPGFRMKSIWGNRTVWLALVASTPLLSACDATNLYLGHRTIVGLNAAVNQDQTTGHIIIGYDRKFGAVVPVSAPAAAISGEGAAPVNPNAREAMSVLSCSELEIDGIFLTGFKEYLATGAAAKKFAANIDTAKKRTAMKEIFDCYDDEAPKDGADSSATTPPQQ